MNYAWSVPARSGFPGPLPQHHGGELPASGQGYDIVVDGREFTPSPAGDFIHDEPAGSTTSTTRRAIVMVSTLAPFKCDKVEGREPYNGINIWREKPTVRKIVQVQRSSNASHERGARLVLEAEVTTKKCRQRLATFQFIWEKENLAAGR